MTRLIARKRTTSKSTGIRRRPLARFAAGRIREDILRGRLKPGDELIEQNLCAALAMSRTPIREALKTLSAEGLVAIRRNKAATVASFDRNSLSHLFELQVCIESFAARLAALRIPEDDLAELSRLQGRIEAAAESGDISAYTRLNRKIHSEIVAASGNPEMLAIHGRVIEKLTLARNVALSIGSRLEESVAEHRAILEALRMRDSDEAGRLVENHDQRTAELFMHSRD